MTKTRMTGDARRVQLMDAAARAIIRHGVAGFRLRDVADEAGVSQPLVSTHFRTREELLMAVFVRADELAMASFEARSSGAGTALAALRIELQACLDDADGFQVWQEFWSHGVTDPALRTAVAERQRAWTHRIASLLHAAIADGSARAEVDVALTAVACNALVDGLTPAIRSGYVTLDVARSALDHTLNALAA